MISPLLLDRFLVDRIHVEANSDYDKRDELVLTLDVDPQHLRHNEDPDVHQLILAVRFGRTEEDSAGTPYFGEAVGRAFFHIEGKDLSEKEKAELVLMNGAAILYGLLRGQIAQITAMSHFGTFLLPPTNLVEAFRNKLAAGKPTEIARAGDAVIEYKELYFDYVKRQGVGAHDMVSSSPRSYVSYLNSVARLTGFDITPDLLRSDDDINKVLAGLEGRRAASTLLKYRSAMRQYTAMVRDERL